MKKKNLNFLLALLAALALVFAGACSDGSDDDGSAGGGNGDGNTPTLEDTTVYTTYTYTIDETDAHDASSIEGTDDATYLNSVALRFADLNDGGSSVAITVEYLVCTVCTNASHTDAGGHTNGGDSHVSSTPTGYIDTTYTWTDTATYSYVEGAQDAADTITVTLPADSNDSNANATLTFTVDSESGDLTLTGAKDKDDGTLSGYLVKGTASGSTDETGCDLFSDTATTGYLEASSDGGSAFKKG